MLVLTRQTGEEVVMLFNGAQITLRLVDVKKNRAKFGIEAPSEVRIYRKELLINGKTPEANGGTPP